MRLIAGNARKHQARPALFVGTLVGFVLALPSCFSSSSGGIDDAAVDGAADAAIDIGADARPDGNPDASLPSCAPPGPCDLFTGRGCDGGQVCKLNQDAEPRCVPDPGDLGGAGAPCSAARGCRLGLACLLADAQCHALCCSDRECDASEQCVPTSRGFGICTQSDDCDPLDGSGCAGLGADAACYLDSPVSPPRCRDIVGDATPGTPCERSEDCIPGSLCQAAGLGPPVCRPLCSTDGSAECAAGSICIQIAVGSPLGFCT